MKVKAPFRVQIMRFKGGREKAFLQAHRYSRYKHKVKWTNIMLLWRRM